MKRYIVTSALPYANGPIHIGHLAGSFLPADIYVRYLRSKGLDVVYLCGSDEHGVAIKIKATNENTTPQKIVDKYHHLMQQSLQDFGISFDHYSRTSSALHKEVSSQFFLNLWEKGAFDVKTSNQYFDAQYQQFLADRYIRGTCPKCAYDQSYGDQCESCGSTLNPLDLINPTSTLSGAKPILKETKHWFLPLDRYQNWVKKWLLEGHKDWKPTVYKQSKSWLDHGLEPRAITRDLDWGVPVPLPDAESKVLYVWFEAPIGYITATQEWAAANNKKWKDYWESDETSLIHFVGKDNIVFHCIIFPVMLKAHGGYILPQNVPANEFLNLEGKKISTSRNWAVWLDDYLVDFPNNQDALRYVLCSNAPENRDCDFSWRDFQAKNNNELVAILGNLVHRVFVLTHKYFDGNIPPSGQLLPIDVSTLESVYKIKADIEAKIATFNLKDALFSCMEVARLGNKYLAETHPWIMIKTDTERTATVMHVSLQILAKLSILIYPFLPNFSENLSKMLRMPSGIPRWQPIENNNLLAPGTRLLEPKILFEKIEDETIEAQLKKLGL